MHEELSTTRIEPASQVDARHLQVEVEPGRGEVGGTPASALYATMLVVAASVAQEGRTLRERDRVIVPEVTTADVGAVVQKGCRAGLRVVSHATGRFAELADRASAFSRRVEQIAVDHLGDEDE